MADMSGRSDYKPVSVIMLEHDYCFRTDLKKCEPFL